ncbi:MAG: hypothetical protein U0K36_05215 [Bacteroidales bacterium]|nr:hypothetical protein [Bacteroidales bacterium]
MKALLACLCSVAFSCASSAHGGHGDPAEADADLRRGFAGF